MSIETIFKAIHFTDTHLNPLSRIPASRTATYHADCRAEMQALWAEGQREEIDTYLMSGDIFNLKRSEYYTPENINYYASLFEEAQRKLYTIPGNHDLPKSSYGERHRSAYDVLTKMTSNMVDVSHTSLIIHENNHVRVMVHGIPFLEMEQFQEALRNLSQQIALQSPTSVAPTAPTFHIALIHTDIAPAATPLHWDFISYDELAALAPNINLFCCGHIHQRYDLYFNHQTGQAISKPYSVGRVFKDYYQNLDDPNLRHLPEYALLSITRDTETGGLGVNIEYRQVPNAAPFDRAFQFDTLAQEIQNSVATSEFLKTLEASFGSTDAAFTIQDPSEFLAQQKIPDAVRQTINDYLERVPS